MNVNRIGYASSNFKISIIYNIKDLLEGCSKVASNLYSNSQLKKRSVAASRKLGFLATLGRTYSQVSM